MIRDVKKTSNPREVLFTYADQTFHFVQQYIDTDWNVHTIFHSFLPSRYLFRALISTQSRSAYFLSRGFRQNSVSISKLNTENSTISFSCGFPSQKFYSGFLAKYQENNFIILPMENTIVISRYNIVNGVFKTQTLGGWVIPGVELSTGFYHENTHSVYFGTLLVNFFLHGRSDVYRTFKQYSV
jgi:hypothetical protein